MTDLPDFHISLDEKIEWMIETQRLGDRAGRRAARHRPAARRLHLHDRLPARRSASPRWCVFGLQPVGRPRPVRPGRRDAARRHRDPVGRRAHRAVRQRPALRVRRRSTSRSSGRAVRHRHRLAPRWPVSTSCSCCGPIATASCRPRRASTARLVLAQPVIGDVLAGSVERVRASSAVELVRVRRSSSARARWSRARRRLPATARC